MKQILIITRITNNKSEDEFAELFPNIEAPIEQHQSGISLSIYQGLNFYDESAEETAKKINAKISDKANEVLIVLHSVKFDNIKTELIKLQNNAEWQIRRYSSEDDKYDEIKSAFQNTIQDSDKIEAINKIFSYDPILEAKLELIQKIVVGETRNERFELNNKLKKYQGIFRTFSKDDKDFFTITDTGEFNEYKGAYEKLYDALKIEA